MIAASLSAIWLGILCAISPCPLATNLAAVSVLARRFEGQKRVVASGIAYAVGRIVLYGALSAIMATSLSATPSVSQFLQKYGDRLTGPLLVVIGLILLDLMPFRMPSLGAGGDRLRARFANGGLVSAFVMGVVFALVMCPTSAALFFGGLVPLAVKHHSFLLLPMLFGVATALPVLVLAVGIVGSAGGLGMFYANLTRIERIFRLLTGSLVLVYGLYLSIAVCL